MTDITRAIRKPKLLFEITVDRRPYWRRFRMALILIVFSVAALAALTVAGQRELIDGNTRDIGWLAAVGIIILSIIRGIAGFVRWRNRRNETIRFFNRGFTWESNGKKHQYSWEKLQTIREGGRGIYLGKRPVAQWGALILTMSNKQVFKLIPRHGDLRQFAKVIRPYAAEVTGIRMGRRLREEKPVRVHPQLIVWPGGLQVGKEELPWQVLNVSVQGNRLIIRAKDKGKVRKVRTFDTRKIDNLGGFVELATTTIRTHRS